MTAHPPAPGNKEKKNNNKDLIPQEETMECVKNAHRWAVTFEISEPRK